MKARAHRALAGRVRLRSACDRRHAPRRHLHALQLPDLRHDGAGGPLPRRRRRARRGPAGRTVALALGGDRCRAHGTARGARRAARGADGRRRPGGRPGGRLSADRVARAAVRADRAGGPGLPARYLRPAHAARDRRRGERGERGAERGVHLRLRLGAERLRSRDSGRAGWHGCGLRPRAPLGARRLAAAVCSSSSRSCSMPSRSPAR
jgi:hypothetical protein